MLKADLVGRVAIVTGSTRNVGKAIALSFAENGADVVVNGVNPERGLKVVEEIKARAKGRQVLFEQADITNYAEVQRLVNNTIAKLGKVDIMVATGAANARPAATFPKFFRDTDPSLYMDY